MRDYPGLLCTKCGSDGPEVAEKELYGSGRQSAFVKIFYKIRDSRQSGRSAQILNVPDKRHPFVLRY